MHFKEPALHFSLCTIFILSEEFQTYLAWNVDKPLICIQTSCPARFFPLFFNPSFFFSPSDWRKKSLPKQIKPSQVSLTLHRSAPFCTQTLFYSNIQNALKSCILTYPLPTKHPLSQTWRFTGRVRLLEPKKKKNRHQAPLTVHFRKAAVIYNHWVKCRLALSSIVIAQTGDGSRRRSESRRGAAPLLCLRSPCISSPFFVQKVHFCMHSFARRNFWTLSAEGCLVFIFADQ